MSRQKKNSPSPCVLTDTDNSPSPESDSITWRHYKHLIDIAPDAIFIADAQTGIILEANDSAAKLLGLPLNQIIGIHQSKLHPPQEAERYRNMFEQNIINGANSVYDVHVWHSSGRKVPVQIKGAVTRIGDRTFVFGIFRDLSQQKEMERKLVESEKKYRELYHHARVALFRSRLDDGKLIECNEAFAELLGYDSREQCIAQCSASKHWPDLSQRTKVIEEMMIDDCLHNYQIPLVRCDGTHIWVEVAIKLNPQENYVEGAQFDITAAKILTQIEKRILVLVKQGKCNKEIAKELCRSVRTIEYHRARITNKLHVDSLPDLIRKTQFLTIDIDSQ